MKASEVPAPPAGLSASSRRLWRAYFAKYEFAAHEADLFAEMLKAQELVDQLAAIVEAEGVRVDGKPHGLLGSLRDARMIALRYRKALRFTAEDEKVRRPGRPSGSDWSRERKAGAAALRVAQERQQRA